MSTRIPWTRVQLIEVLKLYCQTPFGRLHSKNPIIVRIADKIGRTPSAVALKAVNFASLDPTIEQKGMSNASALDREVWAEFFANMHDFVGEREPEQPVFGFDEDQQTAFISALPDGEDLLAQTRIRKNQGFFRKMILASYVDTCEISGIKTSNLLVASHIVPWSKTPSLRMNPSNGICLNALHDRAFDRNLITFGEDLSVICSSKLDKRARIKLGDRLSLPHRFRPDPEFLAYHRTKLFIP